MLLTLTRESIRPIANFSAEIWAIFRIFRKIIRYYELLHISSESPEKWLMDIEKKEGMAAPKRPF